MEDTLKEVITCLFNAAAAEDEKMAQKILSNLRDIKYMKERNPENFDLFIGANIRKVLKTLIKESISSCNDFNKVSFIFLQYSFLESNIEKLIVQKEGHGCCADKARFIIRMYLRYAIDNTIPEFNAEEEHYWLPKTGTYEQWIQFCDGLYFLYYGSTEKYLLAYKTLIEAEKRLYKHTLHKWYMKFKDGEVIEIGNSWDKDVSNPLEDEDHDKGEYYLVSEKYVKHRNYAITQREDLPILRYCIVPKADVEEIYKVSEEVMV